MELLGHDFSALAVSAGTSIAQSGLRILLALAAGYVAVRVLRIAIRRLEEVLIRAGGKTELAPGATPRRSVYMGTASSPPEVMVRTIPTAGNGGR